MIAVRGLIIDYVGVLDGTDEDQRRWRNLLETVRQVGIPTAVLSNDLGGPAADPNADLNCVSRRVLRLRNCCHRFCCVLANEFLYGGLFAIL